jgi:hypothetical protein
MLKTAQETRKQRQRGMKKTRRKRNKEREGNETFRKDDFENGFDVNTSR